MPPPAPSLKTGFLYNQIGSAATWVGGFVFSILVVRKLGPEQYSLFALGTNVAGAVTAVVGLGFDGVVGRHVAALDACGDRDGAAALMRRLYAIRASLAIAVGLALCGGQAHVAARYGNPALADLVSVIALLALGQSLADLVAAGLMARLRVGVVRRTQVTCQWLVVAVGLGLLKWGRLAPSTLMGAQAAAAALQLAVLASVRDLGEQKALGPRPTTAEWVRTAAGVWGYALLTYCLAMGLDVLILGYFHARGGTVAFYTVAMGSVGRLAGLASGGLSGIVMPALSRAMATGGEAAFVRTWTFCLKLQAILVVPVLVFALAAARPLLETLYSARFGPAVEPFRLALLINLAIFGLGCGIHGVALQSLGRAPQAMLVRLFTGPLNVVLDLALIPLHGVMGAVWATGIATLATVLLEWLVLRRGVLTALSLPLGFLARLGAVSVIAAGAASPLLGGGLLGLISGGLVYGTVGVAGLLWIKPFTIEDHEYFAGQENRWLALVRFLARERRTVTS